MGNCFAILEELTKTSSWGDVVEKSLDGKSELPWGNEDFGTYWILAGHRIREQVANDLTLERFLHKVLPPYTGGPLVLFRGESRERFLADKIGFSWSQDQTVAEMFAAGLNSVGGGLVLRAIFDPAGILTGPNDHSRYLGEHQYTVYPSAAQGIEVVAEFPSNIA